MLFLNPFKGSMVSHSVIYNETKKNKPENKIGFINTKKFMNEFRVRNV